MATVRPRQVASVIEAAVWCVRQLQSGCATSGEQFAFARDERATSSTTLRTSILLTFALLPACANYDFAAARLPNGTYDFAQLIADLKASGEEQLFDWFDIPLLYARRTFFAASTPPYPDGYILYSFGDVGPAIVHWSQHVVVTGDAVFVEAHDSRWVGWTLLYQGKESRIATPFGERCSEARRCLLLWGRDNLTWHGPGSRRAPAAPPERDIGGAPSQ